MTKAKINYSGNIYIMSERYVKREDNVENESCIKLFDWIEKYHFRHTPITKAILDMNTHENADIEIIKDYGGIPD